MTLGEKIREARKKCGLSQEQLAEKMSVSRSAVAKWETDKGLPDVGNLKILARLLRVSVDRLLDEGENADGLTVREPYDLALYGRGCKRIKKDRMIREKFPEERIYPLFARQEPADPRCFAGNRPDCRAGAQPLEKGTDYAFYLVEKENGRLLVTVTDDYVQTRPLEQALADNSFQMDGWRFIKSNYEIGE